MMLTQPLAPEALKKKQQLLSACILQEKSESLEADLRDPWLSTLSTKRLDLYARLIENTWDETLTRLFPYTHFLLAQAWPDVLKAYRRQFPARDYPLYEMASGFAMFLENSHFSSLSDARQAFPFLSALADYEWQEVRVQNNPEPVFSGVTQHRVSETIGTDVSPDDVSRLVKRRPVWNATAILRQYQFPIPAIVSVVEACKSVSVSAQLQSEDSDVLQTTVALLKAEAVNVLFYRHPETHHVCFDAVNFLVAAFYEESLVFRATCEDVLFALKQSHSSLATVDDVVLLSQGLGFLRECQEKGLLLGLC